MPSLLCDSMVLQRSSSVKLWGAAEPNFKASVITSWDKKEYKIKADASGKLNLIASISDAGGPYSIRIGDGEEIKLDSILLGEVAGSVQYGNASSSLFWPTPRA